MGRKATRFAFKRAEVEAELGAQLQFMLDRGVKPTHWDSHHHACMYPQFFLAAIRVARRANIVRLRTYRSWYFADRVSADPSRLKRIARRCNLRFLPKALYYGLCHHLARVRYGCRTPDRHHGFGRMITDVSKKNLVEYWRHLLANCRDGVSEAVCHPGLPQSDPEDSQQSAKQRVVELDMLTSSAIREVVDDNSVELISYHAI